VDSALLASGAPAEAVLREAWVPVGADPDTEQPLDPAAAYEQRRAYEDAIEEVSGSLANAPDDIPSLERRGALYVSLGYLRAAEQDFAHAAELRPREPRLWLALGRTRVELDLPQAGLDALQRAHDLGLDDQEVQLQIARAYRGLGQCGKARHHYELAFERAPAPAADTLVEAASLAVGMAEDGDSSALEHARRWLRQALAADPSCSTAWLLQGYVFDRWGGGDPGAAYRRAVQLDPESAEAWTNLALFCHEKGDHEGCGDAVRRALRLEHRGDRRRALTDLVDQHDGRHEHQDAAVER